MKGSGVVTPASASRAFAFAASPRVPAPTGSTPCAAGSDLGMSESAGSADVPPPMAVT